MSAGEKYYAFLRQIFRKVRAEYNELPLEYTLSPAVHAMNNTAGSNGLSPTLLVFGEVLRIPIVPSELPDQRRRMKALNTVGAETMKHIAMVRLSEARRRNIPAAADNDIRAGMKVLFFREMPVNEGTRPLDVIPIDNKHVWINLSGHVKIVSHDKVKQYHEPEGSEALQDNALPMNQDRPEDQKLVAHDFNEPFAEICQCNNCIGHTHYKHHPTCNDRKNSSIKSEACDTGIRIDHSFPNHIGQQETIQDSITVEVLATEILKPGDERSINLEFVSAKQAEIDGLRRRDTWKVVKMSSLPRNANILEGRFVCTVKNLGTMAEEAKARFVAQGHKDREKLFIVHDISTLRQTSTKLIISTAAVPNFRVFSHDVKQVYLHCQKNSQGKFSWSHTRETCSSSSFRKMRHSVYSSLCTVFVMRAITGM